MMVITKLDKNQLYTLRDKMEVWWRFIWEPTPDMRGWFAWRRDPSMERWVCIGTLSEKRVLQVVNSQPNPLTEDDSIDFHIWLERFYESQTQNYINGSSKESASEQEST